MHMARAPAPVGVDLVGVCAARRDRIVGRVQGAARVSGASPRHLRPREATLSSAAYARTRAVRQGPMLSSNRKRAPLAGHERGGGAGGDRERDVCHARRELHIEPAH